MVISGVALPESVSCIIQGHGLSRYTSYHLRKILELQEEVLKTTQWLAWKEDNMPSCDNDLEMYLAARRIRCDSDHVPVAISQIEFWCVTHSVVSNIAICTYLTYSVSLHLPQWQRMENCWVCKITCNQILHSFNHFVIHIMPCWFIVHVCHQQESFWTKIELDKITDQRCCYMQTLDREATVPESSQFSSLAEE